MISPERVVARHLWGGSGERHLGPIVERQKAAHQRGQAIVRAYYGASLLIVAQSMGRWRDLIESDVIDPQWPAAWVSHVDTGTGVSLVVAAYAVTALVAALIPTSRWARAAAALGLLQYMAVENGFGKIFHATHTWLYVAIVLVALPHGREAWAGRGVVSRHRFLTVIWGAQVAVLVAYGLPGFWKLSWGFVDLFTARISAFQPEGFAYVAANRIAESPTEPLLAQPLVEHIWIGWVAYMATIYVETSSLLVAFRPRLHRVWGVVLIMFHLGTELGLGFSFSPALLLLGIVLVGSPLAPDAPGWRAILGDVPGVFVTRRWLERRRRRRVSPAVAPGPAIPHVTPGGAGR